MRKLVLPLAIAVAAVGFTSGRAQAVTANSCDGSGNVFNICIEWSLTNVGNSWTLTTDFLSGDGKLFATGLVSSMSDATLGITNVALVAPSEWGLGCTELSNYSMLSACGNSDNGGSATISSGTGELVTITFDANATFLANVNNMQFAAHVGGWGQQSCSIKLLTGSTGTSTIAPENCTPSNSVPEPITMALLGTGLTGLGFIRRRRKGTEVVDE